MLRKDDEPIPGYQLQRFLGRGQYGEVWKATAPGGAGVALKFIALDARHGLKEFHAIQRVKEVRHAHLMPITALWLIDDFGEVMIDRAIDEFETAPPSQRETLTTDGEEVPGTPQMLVVAMLLGDNNLQDELNRYKREGGEGIPVDLLVQYTDEAARGIDFLNSNRHDLGDGPASIQHCDIKPANIMLMGDSIVVCDFGLARTLGDGTATATGMVGSPAYMAPECVGRKPSKASDQYSLAISYYELRTGDLPFTNQTYTAVIDAHRDGNLDFSNVGEAEAEVLKKATALDPESRYESATAFAAALRDAVSGSRELSPSRSIVPYAVAGTALLIAALIGLYAVMFSNPATQSVRIQVTPADAQILIDDKQVEKSADGWFEFSVPLSGTVDFEATSEPFFYPLKTKYDVKQLAELGDPIRLDPNGSYYLDQANKSLAQGDEEAAVADLKKALERGRDDWLTPVQLLEKNSPCLALSAYRKEQRNSLYAGFSEGPVTRWQWTTGGKPEQITATNDLAVEFIVSGANGKWVGVATYESLNIWQTGSDAQEEDVTIAVNTDLLSADIHPSKDLVVIGDADGGIALYKISPDLSTQQLMAKTMSDQVVAAVFPNAEQVVGITIDGGVSVWSIDDTASDPFVFQLGYEPAVTVVQDGQIISAASSASTETQLFPIHVFDLEGNRVAELRGHQDVILTAKLVAADLLATGSESGEVGLWNPNDASDHKLIQFPSSVTSIDATADGRWIAVGLNDGQVAIIDRDNENRSMLLPAHKKTISELVISADESYLVTSDFQGQIKLWSWRRIKALSAARAFVEKRAAEDRST